MRRVNFVERDDVDGGSFHLLFSLSLSLATAPVRDMRMK
jgi:hypothetical protein